MKDYLKIFIEHPEITCFIIKEDKIIFSSSEKGVKPLLDYYNEFGVSNDPLTIVDKIIGKGAVVLSILVGAKSIITPTISEDALLLAKEYNLNVSFENIVPFIINRNKDGRCPIESSVLNINDIKDGYNKILNALKELSNHN